MLFQSQAFTLLFLPAVIIAWAIVERRRVTREWLLIIASLAFYAAWDPRFLPLITAQTALAWGAAALFHRGAARSAAGARLWLSGAIALQLAALAFFKYFGFFTGAIEDLTGAPAPNFSVILPIGISFYTFQIISYLVDLKRGRASGYGFREFALFVLFFPQLIAGPIVRHDELIPQLAAIRPMAERGRELAMGLILFVLGFCKKVFMADPIARAIDPIYQRAFEGRALDFGDAWSGALGFSAQLLLDFSAYTDMALGLALLFGVTLPQNFNAPYRAVSLRDFWRRWHMTLSRFLRDYVYIPLGGSRAGPLAFVGATLGTMTLCGLWHGAGWTFVVWGALHGAGLLVNRGWSELNLPMPPWLGWAFTMSFVMLGWVLFRAPDFESAMTLFWLMAGGAGFEGELHPNRLITISLALFVLGPRSWETAQALTRPLWPLAVLLGAAFVLAVLEVGAGGPETFIYFQF